MKINDDWADEKAIANYYLSSCKGLPPMTEDKPIDWTKPVQTRDGRKVRVLCTDADAKDQVVGLLRVPGKGMPEFVQTWRIDGMFAPPHKSANDLINTPTKREGWIVIDKDESMSPIVYAAASSHVYTSKELAERHHRMPFGKIVRIEWEEP